MAKKKSKNKGNGQQQFLSPHRFMREKARTLPLGKCYITPPNWQEAGMAHVIVSRERPSGNKVMGMFLVDTFCLGVKDAAYNDNMTPEDFEEFLNDHKRGMGLEEISYDEAHNIIYGAIEFAEEGGIEPGKDFNPACYILEEDTDDIPLIEYEYGKNGKHFLVVNPDRKEMRYLNTLKENLGDDFDYIMPYGFDDEDEEDYDDHDESSPFSELNPDQIKDLMKGFEEWQEEQSLYPDEEYSYQYPEYPQSLSVKNQFIADELLSADNYTCLPHEVIDRILALPKDEAAEDIANVVFYVIGKTYKGINDDTIGKWDNSSIMHSLVLLAAIQSDKGLEAVLEIMRQTNEFADFHLGDFAPELLSPALYACGQNDIPAIEEYLNQPGMTTYLRNEAIEALAMVIFNHPDRRDEIIAVFRRLLNNMTQNLPSRKACDGTFAGFVMISLIEIKAKELIAEIKNTFATKCVNLTITGDCEEVIDKIEHGEGPLDKDKYLITDVYKQYDYLKQYITKPE